MEMLVSEQPQNAPSPMLVTLFGMETFVSEEQPKNARPLMLVILSGREMLVNEEHS